MTAQKAKAAYQKLVAAGHEELRLIQKLLRRHLDNAACNSSTRIACRLCLQVVGFFVDDNSFVQDGICSFEGEPTEDAFKPGDPLFISLQVPKIANVLFSVGGRAMLRVRRIEVSTGGREVRRGAIALFMNVKTVFTGRKAFNVSRNAHTFGFFAKSDLPLNLPVGGRT
jgi:hypothetical protein